MPYAEKSHAGLSITDCRAAVSIRVSTATLRAFHRDPAAGGQPFAVYRKPRPARPRAHPRPTLPWTGHALPGLRGLRWPSGCTCRGKAPAAVPWPRSWKLRMFAQNALIDGPLLQAALSAPLAYRDWQLQPTVQPINTNKGISVARSRLAALLQRPLYDLDRVSAPCWRSRPFSTSISAGRRSAIRSITCYPHWPPRLAVPATGQSQPVHEPGLSPRGIASMRFSQRTFRPTPVRWRARLPRDQSRLKNRRRAMANPTGER